MPTSVAATYTLLYASNAREECTMIRGKGPEERARRLRELGNWYRYGNLVGLDGRRHYGEYQGGDEQRQETHPLMGGRIPGTGSLWPMR